MFTLREQAEIMNKPTLAEMEHAILDHALLNLNKATGMEATVVAEGPYPGFIHIRLEHEGRAHNFYAEVKKNVDRQMGLIVHQAKGRLLEFGMQKSLLITPRMTQTMADKCKEMGIQYLDAAGNAYIDNGQIVIMIEGKRLDPETEWLGDRTKTLATPNAIRIVFALLCNDWLINGTYREIQKAAGVALGTVGPTLTGLQNRGFIVTGRHGRQLVEHGRLAAEWLGFYKGILRGKLNPRRYNLPHDIPDRWKLIEPRQYGAQWGGEPAAAMMNGYLRPHRFTLYFDKKDRQQGFERLAKDFRLKPDPLGELEVLDKFWDFDDQNNPTTVPPLLVYADLTATLDPRNLEAAHQLNLPYFKGEYPN
jgi:hypothetical protein